MPEWALRFENFSVLHLATVLFFAAVWLVLVAVGRRVAGVGGFINITQTARRVVFMGTLTADGLVVRAHDGCLQIVREGRAKKLVPRVGHLSFNGSYVLKLVN